VTASSGQVFIQHAQSAQRRRSIRAGLGGEMLIASAGQRSVQSPHAEQRSGSTIGRGRRNVCEAKRVKRSQTDSSGILGDSRSARFFFSNPAQSIPRIVISLMFGQPKPSIAAYTVGQIVRFSYPMACAATVSIATASEPASINPTGFT